jgi:hypothetical protein
VGERPALLLFTFGVFTMALFDDLKNAAQEMFNCEQQEDKKIGNVQIPYKVWINFKKEFEINFIEPEDDEDWQDYKGDLHAT